MASKKSTKSTKKAPSTKLSLGQIAYLFWIELKITVINLFK